MLEMRSCVILASLGLVEYESVETLYCQMFLRFSEAGYTEARFLGAETLGQISRELVSPDLSANKMQFLRYPWHDYMETRVDSGIEEPREQLYSAIYKTLGPNHHITRFMNNLLSAYRSGFKVEEVQEATYVRR
jgi:hypothetical protein